MKVQTHRPMPKADPPGSRLNARDHFFSFSSCFMVTMAQTNASRAFRAHHQNVHNLDRVTPVDSGPEAMSDPPTQAQVLASIVRYSVSTKLRSAGVLNYLREMTDGPLLILSRKHHSYFCLLKKHFRRVTRCKACTHHLIMEDRLCSNHHMDRMGCYSWRELITKFALPCIACSRANAAWHLWVPEERCDCGRCNELETRDVCCTFFASLMGGYLVEAPVFQGAGPSRQAPPSDHFDEYITDHKPRFVKSYKRDENHSDSIVHNLLEALKSPDTATLPTTILVEARRAGLTSDELRATIFRTFQASEEKLDSRATAVLMATALALDKDADFQKADYKAVLEKLNPDRQPTWREAIKARISRMADKLKSWGIYDSTRKVLEVAYETLGWAKAANDLIFNSLLEKAKPIPLMALISTFDGTPRGFVITLTGVLQLYGLTNPTKVMHAASPLIDCLTNCVTKVMDCLNPFGRRGPEPQSTSSFIAVLAGLGVLLALGHMPGPIARTIRNLSATAVSLVAIVKFLSTISKMVTTHLVTKYLRSLTDRVALLTVEVAKPAICSSAAERRKLETRLDKISHEVDTAAADPDYNGHATTLRALQQSVLNLRVKLNSISGTAAEREAPVAIVLCGPPGIGKTTLAEFIANFLDPEHIPSTISFHLDHHDGYSGEDVCVWDEFDTDHDGRFLEAVIAMVNKAPCPLNCDLTENKGKIFRSKYLIMTTNTPTPVPPNHPRAEAFYRRLLWFDICSPQIEQYKLDHPGCALPATLFQKDFSHLEIRQRPYLGIDSKGTILDGRVARPIKVTLTQLCGTLKPGEKPTFQSAYKRYGLVVPDEFRKDALDWLARHINRESGFAETVIVDHRDTESGLPDTPGNLIIISRSERDWKTVSWHTVTKFEEAPDLNTTFGLNPFIPRKDNRHFTTQLYRSIISFGDRPPMHLPPKAHYRVNNLPDLLNALRHVYGSELLPVVFKLGRKLAIKDWFKFLQEAAMINWGPNYHSYALTTPVGLFTIYTQGSMAIYGASDKVSPVDPEFGPKAAHYTFTELVWKVLKRLAHIAFTSFNLGINLSAVVYYNDLCSGRPQSNTRRAYTGIALPDDQYNEWQTYRNRVDNTITVEDYVQAREALAVERPVLEARIQALNRWMRAQRARPTLVDSEAVLQGALVPEDAMAPILRADGTTLGWACHRGHGTWLANTHIIQQEGITLDGHEIEKPDNIMEIKTDVTIIKSYIARSVVQLGTGTPERFYDGRAAAFVKPHVLNIGEIKVDGYTCMLNGGTKPGDCGRPYLNSANQVVGIHSAYYHASSRAVISRLNVAAKPPETWRGIPTVPSGIMTGPLRKGTRFGRSPAYPDLQPWENCSPAPYGAGDPRGLPTQEKILASCLEPYVTPRPEVLPIVHEAARYVRRHLATLLSFTQQPEIEPLAQAHRRLNMATSCGPFIPGVKQDYFFNTPSGPVMKPDTAYARHINAAFALAERGEPLQNAYQLALKDELLPNKKVAVGKKRLLWGTDCALTTLAACVLGDLMDKMKSLVAHSPISVGCNMDGTFPAWMVTEMEGKHTLCLDYSKWDSTMHPQVIHHALVILCGLVPPHPYNESLLRTLVKPPEGYFMDRKVVAVSGLPSGTPGTSILNSVCHCIYFTAAVWLAEENAGIVRTRDPLMENRIFTYGDDCVYGFNARMASNLDLFISALRQLGLNPTAPDKTQNYVLNAPMVFLKREIKPVDDIVVAPLDVDSLVRQATWIKGAQLTSHLQVQKVCLSERSTQISEALIQLSAHGEKVWYDTAWIFFGCIDREHLTTPKYTYEEARDIYRDRYFTSDMTTNLALLDGDMRILPKEDRAVFQNGPEEQQHQAAGGFSAVPVGEENVAGTLTTSYTSVGASAGAAGAPLPDSGPLAAMGAGPQTTMPPGIAGLFVRSARITWNANQPVGTLLGTVPLSPMINPFLSHLSAMYAAWAGSMIVRIQISGSGMFGGRIIAAALPPGISAGSVTNPTAYPSCIMDARLVAPMDMVVGDIRRTTYHLTGEPEQTMTIAIYVSAQLINPYTNGVAAAEITLYTTPGPDFGFSLLREPTAPGTSYANILGGSTAAWLSNRTGGPIISLSTHTSMRFAWNHFAADGTTYGWGDGVVYSRLLFQFQTISSNTQPFTVVPVTNIPMRPTLYQGVDPGVPDWLCTTGVAASANTLNNVGVSAVVIGSFAEQSGSSLDINEGFARYMLLGMGDVTAAGTTTAAATAQPIFDNPHFYFVANETISANWSTDYFACNIAGVHVPNASSNVGVTAAVTPQAPTVYPTPGNVLLGFGAELARDWPGPGIVIGSQPQGLARTLFTNPIEIPDTDMLVFRLTNSAQSFEVGLRRDGYLMTGGSSEVTIQLTDDYTIEVSGLVPLTTPLTGPTGTYGTRRRANMRHV
uniref:Genome polyprotein n=3 Tax=unclassified Caliciviridae TaxID=179239 RepID=A0A5B8KA37_9CALI|nr:polyprotein [Grey teal calicivirus]